MLDVSRWLRHRMLDVGCWMLDVGRWLRHRMLDVGCWMLADGCGGMLGQWPGPKSRSGCCSFSFALPWMQRAAFHSIVFDEGIPKVWSTFSPRAPSPRLRGRPSSSVCVSLKSSTFFDAIPGNRRKKKYRSLVQKQQSRRPFSNQHTVPAKPTTVATPSAAFGLSLRAEPWG